MPITPITVAGHAIEVGYQAGEIRGIGKTVHTEVSSTGGGGYLHNGSGFVSSPQIHSRTIRRQEFWLALDDGTEQAYQLSDVDVPMRNGQRACVVWMRHLTSKQWAAVALHNYTGEAWWPLCDADALRKQYGMAAVKKREVAIAGLVFWAVCAIGFITFAVMGAIFLIGRQIYQMRQMTEALRVAVAEAAGRVPPDPKVIASGGHASPTLMQS